MMEQPIELLEMMGDKIRAAGAPVLALEFERGYVTLDQVCKRLPGLEAKLRDMAERLTLIGPHEEWVEKLYKQAPRAGIDGGVFR